MTFAIERGVERDHFRHPRGRGAHEWWYFDLYDDARGLGVVMIFFRGIPFSGARQRHIDNDPDRYPAVACSLYDREKTALYLANVHDSITVGERSIRIAGSGAHYDDGAYRIALDERSLRGEAVHVEATFEPLANATSAGGEHATHLWIAAAPRCRARVRINEYTLEGIGYHDHNVGQRGLPDQFRTWEWGRAHFDDETFIYYATEEHGGARNARVLLEDVRDARIEREDIRRNIYRLPYARTLRIESGRRWTVEQSRIVDNGPFYLRFLSTFRDDRGRTAVGFSEVLRPAALRWRWFWPLLDSRVRRHDNRDRLGRKITQWLIQQGF